MTVPRLLDAGDGAFTIEFGDRIDPALSARVAALDRAVRAAIAQGALPGVVETMPTFRSLTVLYDPLRTRRAEVQAALGPLLAAGDDAAASAGRQWRLPVGYGGEAGADLDELAAAAGLSREAVIDLHAGTIYRVYMIGFLPGFPFMGDLPAPLHRPRRAEPRLRVPAGAVAVANGLTAVYPWQSPGGWHLIGRCPVPLFDAAADQPSLLAPGDSVRFEPVSPARLAELEAAIAAGDVPVTNWLETDHAAA
ncbi:MAG TPA: 5-oxoprolinase subunit PxpB [Aquabacterium sp.]|nr:5-oxoprolinase subunit PxpB [Aquabacterium sp.]